MPISISIHALRKESDIPPWWFVAGCCISIHALRKESDAVWVSIIATDLFQSTLSVRRATRFCGWIPCHQRFQSTLSVRRATGRACQHHLSEIISIHALRKESDLSAVIAPDTIFISIHALRKESDRAAGHFCPLSETQASCLALSISNNTTGTTNNMPKTSSCLSVSF